MTERDLPSVVPVDLDRPSREGETTVSWIRLSVSGIMLALLGAYLLQGEEGIRPALVLTAFAAFGWALISAVSIAALRRIRPSRAWSFVSTATDVVFVTAIQIAHLEVLPLNFANGPITEIYFVLIGLAAIRRNHVLVLFTGLGAAVVHLALTTAFFMAQVGFHRIEGSFGDLALEINYVDEMSMALMLMLVGWVLAQVTRRLLSAERQTHDLFQHVPDGILIVDAARRILAVNHSLTRLVGAPAGEIEGRPMADWLGYGPGEAGSIPPSGLLGNPTLLRRADGSELPVRTASAPLEFRGRRCLALSVRDLTDQLRLRRQVAQSQKMETLGRLAGGLSRDLRRILDETLDEARSLNDDLDDLRDERTARSLARQASVIHDCAARAREVADRLQGFSADVPTAVAGVDLGGLAHSVARICRNSFDAGIEVVVESDGAAPTVEADGTALTQALLNLCINARDAIAASDGGGGTVLIRVGVERGEGEARIAVVDDGTGMDEETLGRIFDPFFTTKPAGRGTGLGLSMVFGIARKHGGRVTVESATGSGSTFTLHLPVRRSS
jgi:signal transduction histidine kinase